MAEYLHSDVTQQIIGAAFEVHSSLGPGFLESIYEEALAYELGLRGLRYERQVQVPIQFKGHTVGTHVLDLVVNDQVIVELEAITELAEVHKAIVLSYLSATKLSVALLMNFGQQSLAFKRIVGPGRALK